MSRNVHNGVVIADFIAEHIYRWLAQLAYRSDYLETAGVYEPNKYYLRKKSGVAACARERILATVTRPRERDSALREVNQEKMRRGCSSNYEQLFDGHNREAEGKRSLSKLVSRGEARRLSRGN